MQALQIDTQLKSLVKSERKITFEILRLIQVLDIAKSYRELGFNSLFEYLTKGIGYSDSSAQRRISSARLLKQVPSISEDLKSGELNLTQASLAFSAIKQQEQGQSVKVSTEAKIKILHSLKDKNTFQTQQILQKALPQYDPTPKSIATPRLETVQVVLNFSQEQWQIIRDFMAKNSHKVPDQKLESLLLKIANPQTQIKTTEKPGKSNSKNPSTHANEIHQEESLPLRTLRRAIPKSIKKSLLKQANYKCQYKSPLTQKQCSATHFLEVDHIIAVALGGTNEIQNLRILCRQHNALAAKQNGIMKSTD